MFLFLFHAVRLRIIPVCEIHHLNELWQKTGSGGVYIVNVTQVLAHTLLFIDLDLPVLNAVECSLQENHTWMPYLRTVEKARQYPQWPAISNPEIQRTYSFCLKLAAGNPPDRDLEFTPKWQIERGLSWSTGPLSKCAAKPVRSSGFVCFKPWKRSSWRNHPRFSSRIDACRILPSSNLVSLSRSRACRKQPQASSMLTLRTQGG